MITRQDYETPWAFIRELEKTFCTAINFDLAADCNNSKGAKGYIPQEKNSLSIDWSSLMPEYCQDGQSLFLNPPFKTMRPWMKKCNLESKRGAKIISLTLASIGSGWYKDHVNGNGLTLVLQRRMKFIGQDQQFTKDLMITLWGFGLSGLGFWEPPKEAMMDSVLL